MQPNNFNILFNALSLPRIQAYKNYYGQHLSDEELFGCYQWNEYIAHAFFKVSTLIEITMRNRMHKALSKKYYAVQKKIVQKTNQYQWIPDNYHTIGSSKSCNWYQAFENGDWILNQKSQSKIHSKTHHHRQKTPLNLARTPSPDDVVSSLTFGFWSSLIDKCHNVDWADVLKGIFPNHRVTNSNQWNSIIERKRLSYRLDLIRDFRNRIAHHEPIWKFKNLLSENPPLTNGTLDLNLPRLVLDTPTTNPTQSIRRLRSLYRSHLDLLKWMSKELYDDFRKSSLHKHILWLCSQDGFDAHKYREKTTPISMNTCRFKRELPSILKGRKAAYLNQRGRNIIAIQHIG